MEQGDLIAKFTSSGGRRPMTGRSTCSSPARTPWGRRSAVGPSSTS